MLLIINRLTYQQKTSTMKRLHIYVSGIVQGVFFRQSTLTKAKEFGIYGWVKNLRDGRVEIVCEGNEESLKKMVIWCKRVLTVHLYLVLTCNGKTLKTSLKSFRSFIKIT